jgi:hypothetical protein
MRQAFPLNHAYTFVTNRIDFVDFPNGHGEEEVVSLCVFIELTAPVVSIRGGFSRHPITDMRK